MSDERGTICDCSPQAFSPRAHCCSMLEPDSCSQKRCCRRHSKGCDYVDLLQFWNDGCKVREENRAYSTIQYHLKLEGACQDQTNLFALTDTHAHTFILLRCKEVVCTLHYFSLDVNAMVLDAFRLKNPHACCCKRHGKGCACTSLMAPGWTLTWSCEAAGIPRDRSNPPNRSTWKKSFNDLPDLYACIFSLFKYRSLASPLDALPLTPRYDFCHWPLLFFLQPPNASLESPTCHLSG